MSNENKKKTGGTKRWNKKGNAQGNQKSGNKKSTQGKKEMKFSPYSNAVTGRVQYHTFDTVWKAVIAEVSKQVTTDTTDIVQSLELMKYIDLDNPPERPEKEYITPIVRIPSYLYLLHTLFHR